MMWRRTKSKKDEGAVLIATLLIMTLMAGVAVNIMSDVGDGIRRARAIEDGAQVDEYHNGAVAYARAIVREISEVDPELLNAQLIDPQPSILPIEVNSVITILVRDGSNCLSPRDVLSQSGGSDAQGMRRWSYFLQQVGIPEFEGESIIRAMVDWQDADKNVLPGGAEDAHYQLQSTAYRTANSPMNSVGEMRALRGVSQDLFARLQPWICINGDGLSQLNVNTLRPIEAPLLAAALGEGQTIESAQQILSNRPEGGWADIEAFKTSSGLTEVDLQEGLIGVATTPSALSIDVRVDYRGLSRLTRLMLAIDAEATLLSQQFGEAIAPMVQSAQGDDNG